MKKLIFLSAAEPFQEFEIGIGAKAKSLGGSFVSISDDPTAVYWNPAGLSQIKTIQIRNIKIGVAAQMLSGKLTLTCEADQKLGFLYGAEYLLTESIPLRIGKDAYGVGFNTKDYKIDYCYIRKEILGNPQRISLTLLIK